uniref:Uncharacterized protein n=1 Tax=Armadillidium vulgare clopovirus TaxID=2984284 RepID=A0A9C7F7D8_9VIRU|nr:MAG: hypothetical protein [Armadillidium vulgare clopovirus]
MEEFSPKNNANKMHKNIIFSSNYEDPDIIMEDYYVDDAPESYHETQLDQNFNDLHIDDNGIFIDNNNQQQQQQQRSFSHSFLRINDFLIEKYALYGFLNNSLTAENNREGEENSTHLSIEEVDFDPEKEDIYFTVENEDKGTITNFSIDLDLHATPIDHYCLTNLYPPIDCNDIREGIEKLDNDIDEQTIKHEKLRQYLHNKKIILTHNFINHGRYNIYDQVNYLMERIGAEKILPKMNVRTLKKEPNKAILEFLNFDDKRTFIRQFHRADVTDDFKIIDYLIRPKRELYFDLLREKQNGFLRQVKIFDGEFKVAFVGNEDELFHVQNKKHYKELKKKFFLDGEIM